MPRNFLEAMVLWAALLSFSLPIGWFLSRAGLPAAFLLGSMLCGIAFSLTGLTLKLPRRFFQCAQALIGCAVAKSITSSILVTIADDWFVMCVVVAGSILAGGLVGWTLVRSHLLPGTTAAWGSTPGAASAMVAMAEDYGADARLVALMQYLRVLVVVLTASLVAHYVLGTGETLPLTAPDALFDLNSVLWPELAVTLAVAIVGGLIGVCLRIPAGAMLVPMVFGAILHSSDLASIYQPLWMQSAASLLLGWYVGLGFNRGLLVSAFRLLPRLLLSTVMLIILCAISAWLLVVFLHTDPLTAYLSTSPGGLDSVILIAMGSHVDLPFVVAIQTLRLFAVILIGPAIARLICRHA
jgi:hypothetical protein